MSNHISTVATSDVSSAASSATMVPGIRMRQWHQRSANCLQHLWGHVGLFKVILQLRGDNWRLGNRRSSKGLADLLMDRVRVPGWLRLGGSAAPPWRLAGRTAIAEVAPGAQLV